VIPPWSRQMWPEWAPLVILSVNPTMVKVKKTLGSSIKIAKEGGYFSMMIVGGIAAGHKIERMWTADYCHRVKKEFGFARFDRNKYHQGRGGPSYLFSDILEFTRLRFLGLFTADSCKQGPDFEKIKASSACIKWNRNLFSQRLRLKKWHCPMNYPLATVPCHWCELGYDHCSAACHPKTYQQRPCSICKQEKAWFDPAMNDDRCVDCMNRINRKSRNRSKKEENDGIQN
jgi:hypothetical protein